MRYAFDNRLKNLAAACLLSTFAAGATCTLVSPVTADNAAVVAISVNRATKGDRLSLSPIARPTQLDPVSPRRTLVGCEPAISPFVDPTRHLLTHCMA